MGGALPTKMGFNGAKRRCCDWVFNPPARIATIDLRSLPTAVMEPGCTICSLATSQHYIAEQELRPPLARTWTVKGREANLLPSLALAWGLAPRKGKKSSCRADDGHSKPAIGD